MKPTSRRSGIFAENLPEEVVLYDKARDKVHCLSKPAAIIWDSSDGSRTVDDLVRIVEEKSGTPADRKLVLQALEELEEAGLMQAGSDMVADAGLTSRREAVGKIAMAGSALVATIVAAAPTAHASVAPSDPPSDPPPLPISHNPPDPPPTGHNPTGPTTPGGHNPTGPTTPTGHNPTGPTTPTGHNPTGPTAPTGHNPTGPTAPTGHNPTGPTTPTSHNPTGPTTPTGHNPTGPTMPTGGNKKH